MELSLRGEPISSAERSVRLARPGRVCDLDGCGTRLSVYNPGARCSIHAPMVVPRTRGRKLPVAS
jgi:hypothetical protein